LALCTAGPHFRAPHDATGAVDLEVVALGYLESWVLAAAQGWFGLVSYRLAVGDGISSTRCILVPQWALKWTSPSEVAAARSTGQLPW
jgi:hypothetical protein